MGLLQCVLFLNSVFVGLPMNTGLFGDEAVPVRDVLLHCQHNPFWTIGNYLISRSGEGEKRGGFLHNLKKIVSPPLVALAVCLPLAALGVKMPQPLLSSPAIWAIS